MGSYALIYGRICIALDFNLFNLVAEDPAAVLCRRLID